MNPNETSLYAPELPKALIGNNPPLPYPVEEALNRLRINVSFLGNHVRRIMVTSSEPNEGKSFIAMSLWKQMARAGVKSVLVDVDMRNSEMVLKNRIRRADGKQMLGLSHYLSGDVPLEECLMSTEMPCGDLLPNVNNVVNPSMLLESDRFGELLDILSANYRYVFLDTPPLGMVSDGERIGHLCDGAILCVRSAETTRSMVRNSMAQLERSGCKLLGVALNRVGGSTGKYGKYYGKKYYGKYYGGKYGEKYYGRNGKA